MARSRNGEAVSTERKQSLAVQQLEQLLNEAHESSELGTWRRAKAVLGYIEGRPVIKMAAELGVDRSAIHKWLTWYQARGADGLRTRKAPGASCRLTEEQRRELRAHLETTSGAAGGVAWTGPKISDWIHARFSIRYHAQYIPRLLRQLGIEIPRRGKRPSWSEWPQETTAGTSAQPS